MTSKTIISTYEYGADIDNVRFGIMSKNFVMINLNYPRDEFEIDMIDSLLQKYKKIWLCGKWQQYSIPNYQIE